MRVGETLGGLLNASFGNATELITAIIALAQGQVCLLQPFRLTTSNADELRLLLCKPLWSAPCCPICSWS